MTDLLLRMLDMPMWDPNLVPWLIALSIINVLGLGAVAAVFWQRARRAKQQQILIRATILDYFRRSGVEVKANCVSIRRDKRYTAFVESEPMKRFRLSHIIEMTLREHISKTCGLELEKIYWRFPIKEADRGTNTASDKKSAEDDYINEGLVHYNKDLPKADVSEIPWETFEEVTTSEMQKFANSEPAPEVETSK